VAYENVSTRQTPVAAKHRNKGGMASRRFDLYSLLSALPAASTALGISGINSAGRALSDIGLGVLPSLPALITAQHGHFHWQSVLAAASGAWLRRQSASRRARRTRKNKRKNKKQTTMQKQLYRISRNMALEQQPGIVAT